MTIDDLMQQIQETERLITAYRNADEVIVGTQDQIYSRRGIINRLTLTAAEIGDQIVNILERRVAALRESSKNSTRNAKMKTGDRPICSRWRADRWIFSLHPRVRPLGFI